MSSTTADTTPVDMPWYVRTLRIFWGEREPNMCDVIAFTRGWRPLVKGEQMTVHYDDKEYVITRKK